MEQVDFEKENKFSTIDKVKICRTKWMWWGKQISITKTTTVMYMQSGNKGFASFNGSKNTV